MPEPSAERLSDAPSLNVRLPQRLYVLLVAEAQRKNVSASAVARWALETRYRRQLAQQQS